MWGVGAGCVLVRFVLVRGACRTGGGTCASCRVCGSVSVLVAVAVSVLVLVLVLVAVGRLPVQHSYTGGSPAGSLFWSSPSASSTTPWSSIASGKGS